MLVESRDPLEDANMLDVSTAGNQSLAHDFSPRSRPAAPRGGGVAGTAGTDGGADRPERIAAAFANQLPTCLRSIRLLTMALLLSSVGWTAGIESHADAAPNAKVLAWQPVVPSPAPPPVPAKSAPAPMPKVGAPTTPTAATSPASAPAISPPRPPPPTDAVSALERIRFAYEYGDIDEVVESARQVTEGRLPASPAQRAYALRYLGIGLFLTGRTEGAETAFFELLRLRPDSLLDPRTTRPDVVGFFEQVRTRYDQPIRAAARANNRKVFAWNFLPPAGQFQNGHPVLGYTVAGLEFVSLATAVTTFSLLKHWRQPGDVFADPEQARATKIVDAVSVAVFAATYLFGVIDGIAHYSDPPDEAPPPGALRMSIAPGGFSVAF